MDTESIGEDRHLLVVRLPDGLPGFASGHWVAVEDFEDEWSGRQRFHAVRVVIETLRGGAVLVRAFVAPKLDRIEYLKTVMSKDTEFWRLYNVDIVRATPEQRGEWTAAAEAILAKDEADSLAMLARRRRRSPGASSKLTGMLVGAAGGLAAVAVAVSIATAPEPPAVPLDASTVRARSGGMSITLPDPADPKMLVEYEMRPDGTRREVRKFPRDQQRPTEMPRVETPAASPGVPSGERQQRSLADGINGFSRFRQ